MDRIEHHLFVIFGATGDLTKRKLLPALYRVMNENEVADRCVVLGVSPGRLDDDGFRRLCRQALTEAGIADTGTDRWAEERIFHQFVDRDAPLDELRHRIEQIEAQCGLPGNRAFYLALPPPAFPGVVTALDHAGLDQAPGWARLVIEKPFGSDLESARALNQLVHAHFDESQVYRIDHYLGKESVQNLLTFRFTNPIFETTWTRDRLDSVEITVAEDLGVETRGGYYDGAGVLRDMMQNHLTQLLTLVAMEAPSSFTADAIRQEKVQVLESMRSIDPAAVVLGQYTAGSVDGAASVGYLDEDKVATQSRTATFAAVRVNVHNWRWEGVPFYLRTGKRLAERTTQIAITYKKPPVCIFHGIADDCPISPNVLVLTMQPHEGFEVRFELKEPGTARVVTQPMSFDYADRFPQLPSAYQTLLLDVIIGDQTLFVRADEVEASWNLWTPLLERDDIAVHPYPAGSWGPPAANDLLTTGDDRWTMRMRW
ncbi:MAG: glucose-6-phosphate dehydrogenase [Acidimicrobiia bacterium]|nr:glucose-6-phosphate dehydrogenase [Acidimicrobiia bacterium]